MYRAITENIEVTAEPEFAPDRSNPDNGTWFWTYTIEIRNLGEETVQLRARHWEITDARGVMQVVDGVGVVGEQPILRPGQSFRYTSGCPLRTAQGIMRGRYEMVASNGRRLEVSIPAFSLDAPSERPVLN